MKNEKYVLKLDGDYYAGRNHKYMDMINLSGSGAVGAEQMDKETAEKLKTIYNKNGWQTEIELYEPKKYLKKVLEEILKYEEKRTQGKEIGYAIHNLAMYGLDYLKQI